MTVVLNVFSAIASINFTTAFAWIHRQQSVSNQLHARYYYCSNGKVCRTSPGHECGYSFPSLGSLSLETRGKYTTDRQSIFQPQDINILWPVSGIRGIMNVNNLPTVVMWNEIAESKPQLLDCHSNSLTIMSSYHTHTVKRTIQTDERCVTFTQIKLWLANEIQETATKQATISQVIVTWPYYMQNLTLHCIYNIPHKWW